ncbi:MAG: SDR family NAD(P)-dependent oxidoreductase [Candidatus Limnocylindrales bacterium]
MLDETRSTQVAVVGLGAILPDAPDAQAFWRNVKEGRYSITEVPKERWNPDLYYDPDPRAPDKTYSKIGGWVREGEWMWDPFGWHLPIPPTVGDSMEDSQKWAIACTREALADYGYPGRSLNTERTAVILGNALAGDEQFVTGLRILYPEFAEELAHAPALLALPPEVRAAILEGFHAGVAGHVGTLTGDTVLGELSNILAGRVANLFNFHGPNFTMDAACASALAAMNASVKGLIDGDFDVAVTGGIDGNMGPVPFVKFSKLGALSATGTRPYDEGADGFVMGEGAAVFLLKRLADAERDGDRIHAVIRGLAGSSDGKGRGLTAPNPVGQRLAMEWAWERAGLSPATAGLIEGHGTSTALGDVVEVESLHQVFGTLDLPAGSIALGSAKSNIGHLKAAAGAAGLLKAVFALHEKVLPPSLNFNRPNPNIDWAQSPFFVNTELREWDVPAGGIRRAGVSAFGFGGTNFHAVLDEYVPGASSENGRKSFAVSMVEHPAPGSASEEPVVKAPLRGALVVGAGSTAELVTRLLATETEAAAGRTPVVCPPPVKELRAPERVAIDFGDAAELKEKAALALHALATENRAEWKALRARGIFRGSGAAPKVAFLYTGQGSQYLNMLATLHASETVVREVFDEADRVTTPLLGKPLSQYIFIGEADPTTLVESEADLMQTDVTQPAVLATDLALSSLLAEYGIAPDMVMGHSMGEYAALVAAGCLSFEGAVRAVSARGQAVASLEIEDRGEMAAVFASPPEVERILHGIDGYVLVANFNSNSQAVISGASEAVAQATRAFETAGYRVAPLPISHAFHSQIVAPATEPLKRALAGLDLQPARLPIVANVSGEFYPAGPDSVSRMLDMLAAQMASPVQFVKGLHTLYEAGARVFVELGPKSALHGFVEDVLGDRMDVLSLFTNHPKLGDVVSFNHALCGLYATGLGAGVPAMEASTELFVEEPISVPSLGADDVTDRLLALVADKTGYPQDMLDVDLDLEADLGIDTVKQAEVFASIRNAYAIPRDDTVKLRDFPTLAHVIRFIVERARPLQASPEVSGAIPKPARALAGLEPVDAVARRVPLPVLRPPLEICKPTGVVLAAGSRVVIMPDRGGIAKELIGLLEDRGVAPLVVEDAPDAAVLQQRLESWAAEGVIQGVYWLPALDAEPSIGAMGLDEWREALRRRVKLLSTTMRSLYEQIAAEGTFLVTATRLGGMHGYDEAGAVAPMGGAVTGFAKAYKRERIHPLVKALDVEAATDPAFVAGLLVEETVRDAGTVEIGHREGLRWSVALQDRPADDGRPGLPLTTETIFVVTGAAGGIVSAIVSDLAAASGGTFHLLDLAPEPDPSDPDLARFIQDRDGLKRALFDRIKARGERATPVMVERELASIERKRAGLSAIEAIRFSGGTAHYHELDLTDAAAVSAVIDGIRQQHGRIDVLIHAAGIEISHLLPDKEAREFDRVFDVKADGWFNLLHAIGDMSLGATVAFTSVAGRFGNTGQTDYAAANDLLCKCTSSLRSTRPGTRGIAIDWTAWADIGMATRGSIPKMMEAAGIDMMLPETGIPVVRRELVAGGTRGEVVIAGSLGTLTEDWDASGGLDPELATRAAQLAGATGPMVGRVTGMSVHEGLTVETVLDPKAQPFLWDHRMDGTALLPGVMGAEAFAELARVALPAWRVVAVEDMRFQAPFKFYRDEPRTLLLGAVFRPDGQDIVAECRLTGERTLPLRAEPQVTTHFMGKVRLTRAPLEPARIEAVALPERTFIGATDIYRVYFHGPSYRVLDRAWPPVLGGAALGVFAEDLPPDHTPASAPLVASPRLIELCFQTIGIWELTTKGRFALPHSFERVTAFGGPKPGRAPLMVAVTARDGGETFDAVVVDAEGIVCVKLEGYRSVELPGAIASTELKIFQGG